MRHYIPKEDKRFGETGRKGHNLKKPKGHANPRRKLDLELSNTDEILSVDPNAKIEVNGYGIPTMISYNYKRKGV